MLVAPGTFASEPRGDFEATEVVVISFLSLLSVVLVVAVATDISLVGTGSLVVAGWGCVYVRASPRLTLGASLMVKNVMRILKAVYLESCCTSGFVVVLSLPMYSVSCCSSVMLDSSCVTVGCVRCQTLSNLENSGVDGEWSDRRERVVSIVAISSGLDKFCQVKECMASGWYTATRSTSRPRNQNHTTYFSECGMLRGDPVVSMIFLTEKMNNSGVCELSTVVSSH